MCSLKQSSVDIIERQFPTSKQSQTKRMHICQLAVVRLESVSYNLDMVVNSESEKTKKIIESTWA